MPGVAGVAPYAEIQALALRTPEMLPVVLRGIDPSRAPCDRDRPVDQTGSLTDLKAGSDNVIVGAVIADRLGLARGDDMTLLIPTVTPTALPRRNCGSSKWRACLKRAYRTMTAFIFSPASTM